jgi:hypothetical protein
MKNIKGVKIFIKLGKTKRFKINQNVKKLKKIPLYINLDTTIQELKNKIFKKLNFNSKIFLELQFFNKILANNKCLYNYNIKNNDTLELYTRKRIKTYKQNIEILKKIARIIKIFLKINFNSFENIIKCIDSINPGVSAIILQNQDYFFNLVFSPIEDEDIEFIMNVDNNEHPYIVEKSSLFLQDNLNEIMESTFNDILIKINPGFTNPHNYNEKTIEINELDFIIENFCEKLFKNSNENFNIDLDEEHRTNSNNDFNFYSHLCYYGNSHNTVILTQKNSSNSINSMPGW